MRREAELERRLHTLHALQEAIGAMKSLSAHHLRETRAAALPARSYREGVERVLQGTGASLTAGDDGAGLLVIGGELGLCGAHNAHVARFAGERRALLGAGPTLCVGRRAAMLMQRHAATAWQLDRVYPGPTSVTGATELLLRLAEDVLTRYVTQRLASFDIVASHFGGVGSHAVDCVRLLPVHAPGDAPAAPTRYVTREQLADAGVREFLYITLYERLLDALAAEHSARLIATQSAEQWLEERSEHLHRYLTATRREASTQEMLEIAAGARVRRR